MEIRALTPKDDLLAVGELYAQSWKHHYAGILPEPFLSKLNAQRWSAMLHADPHSTIAAFEDGHVLGAATLVFSRDPLRENYGEIASLYLHPSAKGRGIGRRLLEASLERFGDEGCESVCLWVMQANAPAIAFYEHLGFRPSGRAQAEQYGSEAIMLTEYVRMLALTDKI